MGVIAVIGGAGHVGLPLSLAFTECNESVVVIDKNTNALEQLRAGQVPFFEPGAESKLAKALQTGDISFSSDFSALEESDVVIVVVGTPVGIHGHPKSEEFLGLIERCVQLMKSGSLLVLRSTISPGTSERVRRFLEDSGRNILLAYCPERISEHQAFEELSNLAQIVSGTSAEAERRASELFLKIASQVVALSPLEAELAKLFSNAWRYSKFAIANEFRMICDEFGVEYERVREGVSTNYPRAADMARSGLAAGPCLPKDTQQLISSVAQNLPVLRGALITNEDQPKYIRQKLVTIADRNSCVGILGMSFKPRSDDTRDSLAYRVKKELQGRYERVVCADPHIRPDVDSTLISVEELLRIADVVVIGCPHPEFAELIIQVPVVDVWGSREWFPAEN